MKTIIQLIYKILLFTIIILNTNVINADIPDHMPTPNAASLGIWGDIPVSLSNGKPNICIPLFSTSVRGIEMPISLCYDATGVRLNSLPSWTGYNWTLNAGGVITRAINRNPDEYEYSKNGMSVNFINYFKGHNRLEFYTHGNQMFIITDAVERSRDLEPDVFYFNFMGKSGSFFLGNDGQWRVSCEENLEIIYDVSDSTQLIAPFIPLFPKKTANYRNAPLTIPGFKIRDTQGTVYEFGYTTDAIEYTTHFFSMSDNEDQDSWLATSWYLTSVKDRFGNELYRLNYSRGKFCAQFYHIAESVVYDESISNWHSGLSMVYGYSNYDNTNPTSVYDGQLDAPVFLTSIHASNGVNISFNSSEGEQSMWDLYRSLSSVTGEAGLYSYLCQRVKSMTHITKAFYYLTDAFEQYIPSTAGSDIGYLLDRVCTQKLNKISVYYSSSGNYQEMDFDYDYDGRMMLEKIKFNSYENGGPIKVKSFEFSYNHKDSLPVDCLTNYTDHWGYYNGVYSSIAPNTISQMRNYKSTRNPIANRAAIGLLSKITYPTGGVTAFEYENNTFSQTVSLNRQIIKDSIGLGGGMRIKRISEYEDSTCTKLLKRRTYTYNKPNTSISSGQLTAVPVYLWENWMAPIGTYGQYNAYSLMSMFRTTSIHPLSNSMGTSVIYTNVKETSEDGSYTEYCFSGLQDNKDMLFVEGNTNMYDATPFDKFSDRSYRRGKLIAKTDYDTQGNKVSASKFLYNTTGLENDKTYASSLTIQKNYRSGQTLDIYESVMTDGLYYLAGRLYRLFPDRYDVKCKIDTIFNSDGSFSVNRTDYNYKDNVLTISSPFSHVARERTLSSVINTRGTSTTSTTFLYPFESNKYVVRTLTSENNVLTPVSTRQFYNNVLNRKDSIVFSEFIVDVTNNNKKKYVLPKMELVDFGDGIDTTVTFLSYTKTGALKQYQRLGEQKTTLRWTYNDNYLVYKQIGIHPYDQNFSNNDIFGQNNNLAELLKARIINCNDDFITGYSYFGDVGLLSKISPNGVTEYYRYNFRNQLLKIMDDNQKIISTFQYNYRK